MRLDANRTVRVRTIEEAAKLWRGNRIFEGDVVTPVWVSPSGVMDGLNEDNRGQVIYKAGQFMVKPRYEAEYAIADFVKKRFIGYRSNVGEIYDYADNIFLGRVNQYDF